MKRIDRSSMLAPGGGDSRPQPALACDELGRALVPVAQTAGDGTSPSHATDVRPVAPFLTQLIATAQGAPQTRTHRRAEPDRVIAAYAAAMRVAPTPGQAVRART